MAIQRALHKAWKGIGTKAVYYNKQKVQNVIYFKVAYNGNIQVKYAKSEILSISMIKGLPPHTLNMVTAAALHHCL